VKPAVEPALRDTKGRRRPNPRPVVLPETRGEEAAEMFARIRDLVTASVVHAEPSTTLLIDPLAIRKKFR
jgi:hypothetical protein